MNRGGEKVKESLFTKLNQRTNVGVFTENNPEIYLNMGLAKLIARFTPLTFYPGPNKTIQYNGNEPIIVRDLV